MRSFKCELLEVFPFWLFVSVAFAPYIWHHDQVVMLPLQLQVIADDTPRNVGISSKNKAIVYCITAQLIMLSLSAVVFHNQSEYVAFPLLMFLTWSLLNQPSSKHRYTSRQ